jgi:1,4-alpha-glucan branching enzyme
VLADQLEAPEAALRCREFLEELREETHRLDILELTDEGRLGEAAALEQSLEVYRRAAERWREIGGDLLGAFAQHAAWTSSATHEVLPLAAVDGAVRLQVRTGIESHRRRFGSWNGGFWLPECAHAPWLDRTLAEAGVRASVVDWTDVLGFGSNENLRPHASGEGNVLMPLDRQLLDLVWHDDGYPSDPAYRDHHGLTTHHHRAWANDGEPWDPERAAEAVSRDAAAFVSAVLERLASARASMPDPLAVVAADTELFGHWWHEGVDWLGAVVREADERGLRIQRLDEAIDRRRVAAVRPVAPPVTTWGRGRTLETWSSPKAARYAWRIREAELRLRAQRDADPAVLRALMALEASDWAFLDDAGRTGDYPEERARAHRSATLVPLGSDGQDQLAALAPDLRPEDLLTP